MRLKLTRTSEIRIGDEIHPLHYYFIDKTVIWKSDNFSVRYEDRIEQPTKSLPPNVLVAPQSIGPPSSSFDRRYVIAVALGIVRHQVANSPVGTWPQRSLPPFIALEHGGGCLDANLSLQGQK